MYYNYNFANILIRVKNGYNLKHKFVEIPYSKLALNMLKLLYKEGLIANFFFKRKTAFLLVKLKYSTNKHFFNNVILVSKPGRRVYCNVKTLKSSYWHKPIVIVSTTKGLLLHRYAITKNLGGEVMCIIDF